MVQNKPRTSSQHKGNLFVPEGTENRDKRQKHEIEEEGEGNNEGRLKGLEERADICFRGKEQRTASG